MRGYEANHANHDIHTHTRPMVIGEGISQLITEEVRFESWFGMRYFLFRKKCKVIFLIFRDNIYLASAIIPIVRSC